MSPGIWVEPVISGLVFGLLFGLLFPIVSQRLGLPKGAAPPVFPSRQRIIIGLSAGFLFGALRLLDALIEAGQVGQAWIWLAGAVKWFGLAAMLGGLVIIAMRWRST